MNNKSNLTAFWFIPLVAVILAGMFTIIGVIGWKVLKSATSNQKIVVSAQPAKKSSRKTSKQVQPQKPVVPVQVPQSAAENQKTTLPQLPKTGLSFSPARARFEMAFAECLDRDIYPCSWQDTQDGVLKQFSIAKKEGIIVRNIHQLNNTPMSQTAISQKGQVLLYRADNTTWYFDNAGLVRHIAVGAVPRAGADDPHDSYFYDINGQLNSCVCADNTTACCERAPQLPVTSPRTYCGLFAPDGELCPLP